MSEEKKIVVDPNWTIRGLIAAVGLAMNANAVFQYVIGTPKEPWDVATSLTVAIFWGGIILGGVYFLIDFVSRMLLDNKINIRDDASIEFWSMNAAYFSIGLFVIGMTVSTANFADPLSWGTTLLIYVAIVLASVLTIRLITSARARVEGQAASTQVNPEVSVASGKQQQRSATAKNRAK